MSVLNSYIIDYDLIDKFGIENLKTSIVLPIQSFEFYTLIAVSNESEISHLASNCNSPLKTVTVKTNEILFYLSEYEIRRKIFTYAKKSINNSSNQININLFFESLLDFAIYKNSSDIHFETTHNSIVIKYRIDGMLQQFFMFELEFYPIASSVIKLYSQLDITQKRVPMNGRFSKEINNHSYDFRVSIMPTINGESIVIRILNQNSVKKDLDELGFDDKTLKVLKDKINFTQGMILITGPTGSGKTTTLYSILKLLSKESKKIITIEDPVEYNIANVQQISINNEIGLTFSEVLKNVLRQDPDVLMIGEIRDKESLDIAIQASLTGHLVLSTLHTNDSISTINRLLDLQAEPFLVASTLKTIISQRLVLKLCEKCKVKSKIENVFFEECGCPSCNLTGFKDREIISEVFVSDEKVSSMIAKNIDINEIISYCKELGFTPLYENGMKKVKEGIFSKKEIYKATTF